MAECDQFLRGIDSHERLKFDGLIADMYMSLFPRRLMVLEEDIGAARIIVHSLCPEYLV